MKALSPRVPLVAAVATFLLLGGAGAAYAAGPGIGDVSDAMRYDVAGPIGSIVTELSGEDDDTHTVPAPFALNFFGQVAEGVCITTNGGIYPVALASDGCSNSYDENLASLAESSSAPIIAVLAADLDLGNCDDGTPDGWGTPCEIYFGTTTVDGRDAFVVTWYRVPMYSDDNDSALSGTFQMVIVKRATGSDVAGWDFDIEFNYGTLADPEDGYSSVDPASECDSFADVADCRWGVGWANYDAGVADPYELFATTPITELIDGGAKSLVANKLNSTVNGRYSFAMVAGATEGFEEPVLGTGTDAVAGPELADTGPANTNIAWLALALVMAGTGMLATGRRLAKS